MAGGGDSRPGRASQLAAATAELRLLASADVASVPVATQAELLKEMERLEAGLVAARARVLAAFSAREGYADDGLGGAKGWLAFHTRVTRAAAAGHVAWWRRLAAHPEVAGALAVGELSVSWARHICAWTDRLPESRRADADRILCGAAVGGAELGDLAGLAEQMRAWSAEAATGGQSAEDPLADRWLRLATTFDEAGRLEGDLSAGCAAALGAVLDALGKKRGPEDIRSVAERRHDALEDACRRLIASGMLPGRAGQSTQVQVHMSLRDLTGAGAGQPSAAEAAWRRATHVGWLTGAEADAAACDATIVPVVTGHVDWTAVARLAEVFLEPRVPDLAPPGSRSTGDPPTGDLPTGDLPTGDLPTGDLPGHQDLPGARPVARGPASHEPLAPHTRARLERSLLAMAVSALSGPGGLAAALRARRGGPLASVSLPLDVGSPTAVIPPHLRRALGLRHPRCAFPGCRTSASACDIHHLIPRSKGGRTKLSNLLPLCRFHHLIVIHQWGWQVRLNPDGTTTATGPDGRVIQSHGPPEGPPGQRRPEDPPGDPPSGRAA